MVEISNIKCKESCVDKGIMLGMFLSSVKNKRIGFKENFIGIVPENDLKIPYSELAIHTKTAGKDIVAFGCSKEDNKLNWCGVVYSTDGGCGYIEGKPSELLHHELRKVIENR